MYRGCLDCLSRNLMDQGFLGLFFGGDPEHEPEAASMPTFDLYPQCWHEEGQSVCFLVCSICSESDRACCFNKIGSPLICEEPEGNENVADCRSWSSTILMRDSSLPQQNNGRMGDRWWTVLDLFFPA